MSVCTFFGHSDGYGLDRDMLCCAIEGLIGQGVDTFYVGNHGVFDAAVRACLKKLCRQYPHICYAVVLAYLPREKQSDDFSDTIYPEAVEAGLPKFAIDRRNKWMLQQADIVICHIRHTWGGAYKFVRLARKQGKRVINLYEIDPLCRS